MYYGLWAAGGQCPYDLVNSGFWYPNVFGWPRLWYSEAPYFLNLEDYILFAEKKGETLGFIHWWPNLYPLLMKYGLKSTCGTDNSLLVNRIREGKIFKVIVGKRVRGRELIKRVLISEALKIMREKLGFNKCQIGNMLE